MKKYRFTYSFITKILLFIVILFSLGGASWSVFNLVQFAYLGAVKIISYAVLALLCLIIGVLALSVLFAGYYVITETELVCNIGLMKNKISLESVNEIIYFRTENKLVVYYGKDKYTVIVIPPEDYEDFILSIREKNPKIVYDIDRNVQGGK